MTWTDIAPDYFSQYEGMTPDEIGRIMSNFSTELEYYFFYSPLFSVPKWEPFHYEIENEEWMSFWKDVYSLKDKPRGLWDESEWAGVFALDELVNLALISV